MKHSPLKLALVLLVLSLVASASLSADTIRARFDGVQSAITIQYNLNSGTPTTNTSAGFFQFTRNHDGLGGGTYGLDPLPIGALIYAFCIEIGESISNGSVHTWEVVDLEDGRTQNPPGALGPVRADALQQLFSLAFASTNGVLNTGIGAVAAAAVQVAVWEIAYETSGTYNLSDGIARFASSANAAVITTAQGWLDTINDGYSLRSIEMYAMNKVGTQDFVFQLDNPGNVVIPEPSSMALFGLGLLALGALRRRMTA